jgi:CheY-like chemotaxis protein
MDSTARKLRILLVEDNPINQEVASALLETLHCECTTAENGRLALDALAASKHFDLVLMDCQMPEMDGFEATRRIRADERERGSHIPIVALTANAMAGDRELCLAAGMDDFLSKPFQLHELSSMLGKWSPRADASEAMNSKEMN